MAGDFLDPERPASPEFRALIDARIAAFLDRQAQRLAEIGPELAPVSRLARELLAGGTGLLIEAAAGVVEEGDTPEAAVRKEAEQELGCRLHALRPLFDLFPSPGASSERIHLFLAEYAESDRTGPGGGLPAEGEDIEVLELPLVEAVAMARRGEIIDMKTVLLLHAALLDSGSGPAA